MDFGDDVMDGGSDAQRRKKRYHRHTPRQIQQLEAYDLASFPFLLLLLYSVRPPLWLFVVRRDGLAERNVMACVLAHDCRMFKECPHPDENQRAALSRELGLEPRQIKFWFQNRRTQMKVPYRAVSRFL